MDHHCGVTPFIEISDVIRLKESVRELFGRAI